MFFRQKKRKENQNSPHTVIITWLASGFVCRDIDGTDSGDSGLTNDRIMTSETAVGFYGLPGSVLTTLALPKHFSCISIKDACFSLFLLSEMQSSSFVV